MSERPSVLFEPFCGGAVVSLTAVAENLAEQALMSEIDRDVAAFWHAATRFGAELKARVLAFELTRESVIELAGKPAHKDILDHGFRTLVLNRTRRGGILAAGAALSWYGENGKGIASRWYPETLASRLADISNIAHRITFVEADGMELLQAIIGIPGLAVFADPPYTAKGGKQAGRRLYTQNDINHARLFELLADSKAEFLMTYDASREIVDLIHKHNFHAVQVIMKTTHHTLSAELVITPRRLFVNETDKPTI